jgi:hypothetical protein
VNAPETFTIKSAMKDQEKAETLERMVKESGVLIVSYETVRIE